MESKLDLILRKLLDLKHRVEG